MGQPIKLLRTDSDGEQELIAYGRGQAAVCVAQGYHYAAEDEARAGIRADDLTAISGLSAGVVEGMTALGLLTYDDVAEAPVKDLVKIPGVGQKMAAKLKSKAAELSG